VGITIKNTDVIERDLYLERLRSYIDKPLIKVITGIRRCGKSAILALLKNELLSKGIDEKHILHLNFESMDLADVDTAEKLYKFVRAEIKDKKRFYLLLDEIQEVKRWEKAVNSFFVDLNADIYITGSNSHLLSSELATYLAGRYVEIDLYTLSFAEYLLFRQVRTGKETEDQRHEFSGFLRSGGFPVLQIADYSEETAGRVVYDIYSSIILRDVVQRNNIRDVELLERVVRYVFDNVGNKFSAGNVADYFKSQQRRIDLNTVYNYLNALEGAFIIYRVPRYDIKGKEILKTLEKYFVGDPSLIHAVMGYRDRNISGLLENIVFLELKRRGFRVFTGRSDEREIDFIASNGDKKVYVQVAFRMEAQSTIDREFSPLVEIRDHHTKYVVTMDDVWHDNIEGIHHKHIADFLLMKEF
jgi:predicted AAA+ superfamily ATPase